MLHERVMSPQTHTINHSPLISLFPIPIPLLIALLSLLVIVCIIRVLKIRRERMRLSTFL
jgi:hypothetical protein